MPDLNLFYRTGLAVLRLIRSQLHILSNMNCLNIWKYSIKNVIVTAGATDAIYRIADCFHGCRSFIESRPTFSEYSDSCRRSCHKIVENIFDCDIIWLCNPNNPTGDVISKELLASRFKNNPEKIFIVDQSYSSYTDKPTFKASEIIKFDNLLVIDSFTKRFGVPGLRVGYVIGCDKLIGLLRRNAMPWNVSQLGIEAGKYLLANVSSYNLPLSDLLNEANRVRQALNECGITAYDSSTPFFVCELPSRSSAQLKEFLIERFGILIRDASTFDGLTERHFRISVQSMEENNLLINAIAAMEYVIVLVPLLGGWVLDLIFGDPSGLPHPIVGFGNVISFFEHRLNRGSYRAIKGG